MPRTHSETKATREQPLAKYRHKRDFEATPEPSGESRPARRPRKSAAARTDGLSFVIQKHAARRLHYDFRLELDGTLKSWAVPKGPSLDPADKRMAVHVEDHPIEYGGFEGVIPAGHYGAGTVIVWDRGTWIPLGDNPQADYAAGKLKFALEGEKLHGHWTLVRMHGRRDGRDQDAWLLIKERDAEARPAAEFDITEAMPDSVLGGVTQDKPAKGNGKGKANGASGTAKATKATKGTKGTKGTKANNGTEDTGSTEDTEATKATKATKANASAKARKSANSTTPDLPEGARKAKLPLALAPQLATLVDTPPKGDDWLYEIKFDGYRMLARIDGDDVRLFTRQGNDWTSRLKALAKDVAALGLPDGWLDGEIVVVDEQGATDFQALQNAFETSHVERIQFYVFDVPFYAGHDLREVPLVERRALLRQLMSGTLPARLHFSESFEATGEEMLAAAAQMQLEGVIGKKTNSAYVSSRSPAWIKLKCTQRQEFVIGGFTDPKGSRAGLGALLLGVHDADGRLRYTGNVGTGFDTRTLGALRCQLDAIVTDKPPFDPLPKGIKGHWVRPKLVAEVAFGSWTLEGRVRHSVFQGLRTDKLASAVTLEIPQETAAVTKEAKEANAAAPAKAASGSTGTRHRKPTAAGGKIAISHAERVIDASTGTTKGELVRFYDRVAPFLLPHLKGRPIALVRAPAGVEGEQFFQRHGDTLRMEGVRTLDPSLWPGHPGLMEITSESGIVGAAQMNVIEFHTWNATARTIDRPNRIIFDLDPGEGVPWQHVQEAASLAKAVLDELGLASFLKTSGGKGLHVVVPLTPKSGWDEVKDFAQALVQHMAATIPQRFVAKSGARNRVGKIFIDYLRNGVGATTASAFSVRARPGLGVSIPVAWDEVGTLRSGAHWTVRNAGPRLDELEHDDPWADYAVTRQTILRASQRLVAASDADPPRRAGEPKDA